MNEPNKVSGRNVDVGVARLPYEYISFGYIDYTSYVGTWEIYPLSGRLQEMPNFLTVTNPFDKYVWMFLLISLVALIVALITIEKLHMTRMKIPARDIINRSKILIKIQLRLLNNLDKHFSGLIIVVGLLVDEAIEDKHISLKSGYKARNFLILVWLLSGFLITCGYKSVLLSTLVSVEYESPIDTIEDLLNSEKPIFVDTSIKAIYISNDPRDGIKELDGKFTFYNATNGVVPGYVKNR